VVLEWHNNGCPYTQKHYASGNMQQLQKVWTSKGVVWLMVISSAPGEQGYVSAQQENDYMSKMKASPTAALLDPRGDVGKLYSAKTTPHMFVVNPAGVLVYDGAIDSKATTDQAEPPLWMFCQVRSLSYRVDWNTASGLNTPADSANRKRQWNRVRNRSLRRGAISGPPSYRILRN